MNDDRHAEAGATNLQRVSVAEFIQELETSATLEAAGYGLHLEVHPVGSDVTIAVDWQLLMSAVANLLQNAFKYTHPHGHVELNVRATDEHVLIDVCDECGGLPPGKAEELFRPFTQRSADRSGLGLGLGLSIALKAARANARDIRVRDIPGKGCVFTVELPRESPPATPIFGTSPWRDAAPNESSVPGAGGRTGLR
jgi:signal transduction histidine kinase